MRRVVRGWRIHRMSDKSIEDLSRIINSVLRGWINYYGRFYKSALYPIFDQLNCALKHWAMRKYKKLRGRQRRARYWLGRIARREPNLFVHGDTFGQRLVDRSRMNREVHVRLRERLRGSSLGLLDWPEFQP